jgi:4-amino-4-deoxy-L-arabinose transferase-like glycosyltransferase
MSEVRNAVRTAPARLALAPIRAWLARRPATIAEAFLWSLLVAALLRAFSFETTGLDWDESFYVVVAQRWLHGGLPYRDVWDIHPMGVPALYALATWIVGDGLLAARLLALLAVAGTAALLWIFLDRYARARPAGILASLFYLAYMTRPEGLAANTEVFNNLMVTAASFLLSGLLLSPARTVRAGPMFAASLLLGIGLQLKYVVFPEAAALCGTILIWQLRAGAPVRRVIGLAGISVVGGLLPTIVATLYFWWAGALQPYLDATLRANVAYVDEPLVLGTVFARLRYGLLPISGLLVWPAVLVALWRHQRFGGRHQLLCLWLTIWLIAACLDVAMPLKFWKHYFNALVPPLCLIAGLALALLAREWRAGFTRLVAIGVLLTLLPAGIEIVRHAGDSRSIGRVNVPSRVAGRIKAGGTNGHDVYVLNYDPLVYAYSGAAPPSRFVLGVELSDFSASTGIDAATEIGRILNQHPRWIVIAQPSPYAYNSRVRRELDAALRDYRLDSAFQETDYIQPPIEVLLYRRWSPSDGG